MAPLLATGGSRYFYPRSPCGERPYILTISICTASFLSTLSLRRATAEIVFVLLVNGISIHALLAESDEFRKLLYPGSTNFYPRSPCGERQNARPDIRQPCAISIHALLAESDFSEINTRGSIKIFLSTLSLRRATLCRAIGLSV